MFSIDLFSFVLPYTIWAGICSGFIIVPVPYNRLFNADFASRGRTVIIYLLIP